MAPTLPIGRCLPLGQVAAGVPFPENPNFFWAIKPFVVLDCPAEYFRRFQFTRTREEIAVISLQIDTPSTRNPCSS